LHFDLGDLFTTPKQEAKQDISSILAPSDELLQEKVKKGAA